MKKLRWQLLIIFLTGLVVGILLFSEQSQGGSTQAPQPVEGGTYTEALIGSLQRLNPLLDYYNPVDDDLDRLIYSSLIRFDSRGLPVGDLAESWAVSRNGLIYTFTLRDGAVWHDGQPVTAIDVAFTIDMLKQGAGTVPEDLIAFWGEVTVNVVNGTTIQFLLPEPFAPFMDYLEFGILPQHLLQGMTFADMIDDPFNLQPVGSGPYKFSSLIVENDQITGIALEMNEDYYLDTAYIEDIVFRYYPDGPSALAAYQQGSVMGISRVTSDILSQVLQETNLSLYTGREPELTLVFLNLGNTEKPFLQDADVRRALMLGLNRQEMIDRIMQSQAMIANGVIFPGTWAYYDNLETIPYDPETARALLIGAGYALPTEEGATVRQNEDGVQLTFTLLYPDDDLHLQLAQYIQAGWEALGMRVEIEAVPYDELINTRLANRDYDAALVDMNFSRTPDPDPYPFWDQATITGGQNYTQWDDRMASEHLEQARVTLDLDRRIYHYQNFQVLFSQQLPALPLFYPVYTYAVDNQVQGISMGPLLDTSDRFATITQWYMVARTEEENQTQTSGQ